MGEEHKKEGEEAAKDQKQEEKVKKEKEDVVIEVKKEEEAQEIVLKVDMHCEACARKVARSLKGFSGVEEVTVDCKASKVVVKGKSTDPIKVSERIQKKSGRKVEIVSPLPNPPSPQENKDAPPPPPPPEKKEDQPPVVKTVVLKVQMHCEACAQVLQKRIRKIKGVESVTTDLASSEVTVKGFIDPEQLVSDLHKRTRKQAILVKNEVEKKEEESDQKKEEKIAAEDQEEKKEDGKENDDEIKVEVKRSGYYWGAPKNYMEYYASTSYPPQFFSDENPNACSLM